MSTCSPKQRVYASLAEVAQALGHSHRLELLEHLAQGKRSVEDLATRTGLSFANTSRHLQILRRARLVDTERRGKHVLYQLLGDALVVSLMQALAQVGARNLAEVQSVTADYFAARDRFEPVTRKDLLARMRKGAVTVLDVRPEDEFAVGHLPGAVNIPLAQLKRRLSEVPKGREVVAYCRGPYCIFSFEAVAALRSRGFKAMRLEDGYPEWKAAGLPVEGIAKP